MARRSVPPVRSGLFSRRRMAVWLLMTVVLCVVAFTPPVTVWLAKRAIARREPEVALRWLEFAGMFGHRKGQNRFP